MLGHTLTHSLIKRTTSRCPTCLAAIPADVFKTAAGVFMHKACPDHGSFAVRLATDPTYYYHSLGDRTCGSACACHGTDSHTDATSTSADPFDTLSTCIALIEIVDSCNLTCPTCYAASPFGINADLKYTPADEVIRRIESVIGRKGFIDIVQLSGGEPTLHPEFMRLLTWCVEHPSIGYTLVNTNGVRIATDADLRAHMGTLRRDRKGFELYLQFDGPQKAGQYELRGADLRDIRRRAIDSAAKEGIPTTLAMVVTPTTIDHLGEAVRFGLERSSCRGISLQPVFTSGRLDVESSTLPIARPAEPVSVGDIVHALCAQSQGLLSEPDFTPLPCGDPNCHTISYILRTPDGPRTLSKLIDLRSVQGFLENRVDYRIEDLAQCGCENEPLGEIIKKFEIAPDAPFRIFIKPFMDAWTFDQDRIDRCCTHVIGEDGSLDSFCRHYLSRART